MSRLRLVIVLEAISVARLRSALLIFLSTSTFQSLLYAEKIKDMYGVDALIPEFGDVYELEQLAHRIDAIRPVSVDKFERLELLDRIETLKEEIDDLVIYIKDDLKNEANDNLIKQYNDKIVELENMILEIVKM